MPATKSCIRVARNGCQQHAHLHRKSSQHVASYLFAKRLLLQTRMLQQRQACRACAQLQAGDRLGLLCVLPTSMPMCHIRPCLSLSWLSENSQVNNNSQWQCSFCTSNGVVQACGAAAEQTAPKRKLLSLARPATGSALASDAPQLRSTGDRLGKGERCH